MASTNGSSMRDSENEARIESSFRRLLAAIEAERERIRIAWQQITEESTIQSRELKRLKQDTEEWCSAERNNIENEWKRLDKLRERMAVLWPSEKSEVLEINCSGRHFSLPKTALCAIEGSYLNHMFSDAFVQSVPRDPQGRFFLDFNPECFSLIVELIKARQVRPDAPAPPVPAEQQQNMDLLAEVLNLRAFLCPNTIARNHATSLTVQGNTIQATMPGWQVISAQNPLSMSGAAYFEIKVLSNPDTLKGGLAVGVCGHVPQGAEVHSIRIADSALYNSHVGLIGPAVAVENVTKGVQLLEGSIFGVKFDVGLRSLQFYFNKVTIGTCTLKVDFNAIAPTIGKSLAARPN